MHDIFFGAIDDGARVDYKSGVGVRRTQLYPAVCRHYLTTISKDSAKSTKCILVTINADDQVDDICAMFAIAARNRMNYLVVFVAHAKGDAKKMDDIRVAISECIENDPVVSDWTELSGLPREVAGFYRV